jgi:NAD(P) transhydrogenase
VKLLVHAQTREILGVHIFGTLATELVHTAPPGLAVDDLAEASCNFPSYSYAFRIAADDARARLAGAVAAA